MSLIFPGDFTVQNQGFIPGDFEKQNCEGESQFSNPSPAILSTKASHLLILRIS